MPKLLLSQLDADPRNPNVCSPDIKAKLKRHMKKTGLYDYPIVRPHPDQADRYIIIDGHTRVEILKELGNEEAFCQVWKISEPQVKLALATLNSLRGTDNPKKRAELISDLSLTLTPEELAELIPESKDQIQDLLRLVTQESDAMEKALKAEIERETAALPIPLTFLLQPADHQVWEAAQAAFKNGLNDNGKILIAICTKALKGVDAHDPA